MIGPTLKQQRSVGYTKIRYVYDQDNNWILCKSVYVSILHGSNSTTGWFNDTTVT